ncbi:MAG: hypothetical protein ACPLYD_16785 [Anaerolineae bacterium]
MSRRVEIDIIIRSGKTYIPTLYREEKHRLYFPQEPVLVVDLAFESLLEAIQKKMEEGNPPIEVPNVREYRKRNPVPPEAKAAGFKSWRPFAKKARAYGISFLEDKIIVTMSGPSKGGWLVYDPKKTREFPPDTPLEEVVRVIWEDICSIPELWEKDAP